MLRGLIVCDTDPFVATIRDSLAVLRVPSERLSDLNVLTPVLAQEPDGCHLVVFVALPNARQAATEMISTLRSLFTGTLVVLGRDYSGREVIDAIRAGADDYLALDGNLADELQLLMKRIQGMTSAESQRGRMISVVTSSGGAGASLIATNLAAAIAQRAGQCALLDLKFTGGDLAGFLRLKPEFNILDFNELIEDIDLEMVQRSLCVHPSGVHLLAGPEPYSDVSNLSAQAIQQIVQLTASSFPAVVVDVEDMFHREQVRLLADSDEIVLVTRFDVVSLVRVRKHLDHLEDAGISRTSVRLVVNQAGQRSEISAGKAERLVGCPIRHRIPYDPLPVHASINIGNPLILESPTCHAARAIVSLADALYAGDPVITSGRVSRPLWANVASLLADLRPTGGSTTAS